MGKSMNRKEFARVTPEAVGIASRDISALLDKLEREHTEMHGIMIMRDGKICAEGWWNPYAPGRRHGLQSLTKTWAATAVGIAYTQGLLGLEDRVIDLFPQEAPRRPDARLTRLRVRDVLCMGCGMERMPAPTENWIRDFLHIPVVHEPGSAFMYNSMGSTLLGAIVRKLTGQGLHEYLKPRLFDKIGVNADNLKWFCLPDGMEVGGGGLFATTEDNLRLMKLYLDGGVWEGERILAEDYVKLAVSCQNDSSTEVLVNPPATDNFLGYGFQIWMCKPEGVYRADGAMGQFAICCPRQNMIISVNETAIGAEGIQMTLDYIWEFVDRVDGAVTKLPENEQESAALAYRLQHLSVKNPPWTSYRKELEQYSDIRYQLKEGGACFEVNMVHELVGGAFSEGIREFSFHFDSAGVSMTFQQDGQERQVQIAVDGSRRENRLSVTGNVTDQVLMSGCFPAENIFAVTARWPETCFTREIRFHFEPEGCRMEIRTFPFTTTIPGGTVKEMEPGRAFAVKTA